MQIANINGFDRILCDHDDGMIAKTILYIPENLDPYGDDNVSACYAYADSECTVKVTESEFVEAFVKGCVFSRIDADIRFYYIPGGYAGGIAFVNFDSLKLYVAADGCMPPIN